MKQNRSVGALLAAAIVVVVVVITPIGVSVETCTNNNGTNDWDSGCDAPDVCGEGMVATRGDDVPGQLRVEDTDYFGLGIATGGVVTITLSHGEDALGGIATFTLLDASCALVPEHAYTHSPHYVHLSFVSPANTAYWLEVDYVAGEEASAAAILQGDKIQCDPMCVPYSLDIS